MATKSKSVQGKQVAVTLKGKHHERFAQFKETMGFESDAEAARILINARLYQLKRQGKLAKAA